MTRYSTSPPRRAAPRQTHAIWRGIGCILLLIVPLIAWVLSVITVRTAVDGGWPLPWQLLGYPALPPGLWNVRALAPVLAFIQRQQNLYLIVVVAIAYTIAIAGVLSLGYALFYQIVGPPRYGPLDVPQPRYKVGRYKR
jgi:hypothetical protein